MLDIKELEQFLNYVLDKVEEVYQNEIENFNREFIENCKKYRNNYNATDVSLHLTQIKDRVDEIYAEEVNQTVKQYVNELKQRQIRINARKNIH